MNDVGFVTMADADHATGVVALVNSLRLLGHDESFTVLDLGLTASQRRELSTECAIVAAPDHPRHPWLLAPSACLAVDAAIVVYLDCDTLVTTRLDDIFADARAGRVVAFADFLADRWFAEWETAFGLEDPLRRQPYVNAGFVALSTQAHCDLLTRWSARCARLHDESVRITAIDFDDPCALPDQDALNALLMSEVPAECAVAYPASAVAQGRDQLVATRVVDQGGLRCERDGTRVRLLHAFGTPKPWQRAASRDLPRDAYLKLLRRCLAGPDLAIRTTEPLVPWLRPGAMGALTFRAATVWDACRGRTRGLRRRVGLVSRRSDARRPSRAGGS